MGTAQSHAGATRSFTGPGRFPVQHNTNQTLSTLADVHAKPREGVNIPNEFSAAADNPQSVLADSGTIAPLPDQPEMLRVAAGGVVYKQLHRRAKIVNPGARHSTGSQNAGHER